MNLIVIKGRIARDIELKTTQNGKAVANFSVAVNRRGDKENADFFEVVAWENTATFITNYFQKGQEILINGAMQSRKWQDKEGKNRISWEVFASNVEFCGNKGENTSGSAKSTQFTPNVVGEVVSNDDDLPF